MTHELQRGAAIREYGPDYHSEETRIADFQEALTRITVQPLTTRVDISLTDPTGEAKKEFFRSDFQPGVTFYALPEVSHELAESPIAFNPLNSDKKASRHGVFFGSLSFADGLELAVAVKPHYPVDEADMVSRREAETSCLNDYFTNVAAKNAGFDTLEPVGFILDEQGRAYSLTVLDEELEGLDSMKWTDFFEPGHDNTGMRQVLHKTALITALLHDTGDSYHGDLGPRNIGTNPFGQSCLHDWEDGKITTAPSSDVEERFGKTWQDVKTLMQGMVKPRSAQQPGIGMFEKCEGSWWNGFKDVFLDDYLEMRRALAKQGSHHMQRVRDVEAELTQLEHALHLEINRWQQAASAQAEAA